MNNAYARKTTPPKRASFRMLVFVLGMSLMSMNCSSETAVKESSPAPPAVRESSQVPKRIAPPSSATGVIKRCFACPHVLSPLIQITDTGVKWDWSQMEGTTAVKSAAPDLAYLARWKAKGASPFWSKTYNPQRRVWPKTKSIMRLLNLQPGAKVLDVGAGGGFFAFYFSELVGDEGLVYANEINVDLYQILLAAAAKEQKKNIKPLLVHIFQLGVPDESVDIIFSNNVYRWNDCCEIFNKRLVAAHAKALTKGGRVLIVNDFIFPREWNLSGAEDGLGLVPGADLSADSLIALFEPEFKVIHQEVLKVVEQAPTGSSFGYFLLFEKN